MSHPFTWLPRDARVPVLLCLFAAVVAFMVYLDRQGVPLRAFAETPHGILDFELARNAARAGEILNAWQSLRLTVLTQLQVDFGFLVAYPLFLSLACAMLSESPHARWPAVALFLSWAVLLACPLDATENLALLHMVKHGASDGAARLASTVSTVKWIIALAAVAFVLVDGSIAAIHRIAGR
jgi:hypothetical protein